MHVIAHCHYHATHGYCCSLFHWQLPPVITAIEPNVHHVISWNICTLLSLIAAGQNLLAAVQVFVFVPQSFSSSVH